MLLVAVGLSWPMLATNSGFTQDWPNHLWYVWNAGLNIRSDGFPSLFLNAGRGVFYPIYGFYAGSLYAMIGALSLLLGDAPVKAYLLSWLLGFLACYGGLYWLARIAGVGRWLSHAPALVYVTSAYTLTLVYARGAWPEFVATCTIPLFLAASLSILRSGRLTWWPTLALAGATIVFTGSHNITMLWGGTAIALVCLFVVTCIPQARSLFSPHRLWRWLLIAGSSTLVNAWFLVPAIAYDSRTQIGSADWEAIIRLSSVLTAPVRLFTLSRGSSAVPSTGIVAPDFCLALPVVAIAWVLLGGLALLGNRHSAGPYRRLLVILVGFGGLYVLLLTDWRLVAALPGPYRLIQFPYRLESYVLLVVSGCMIALLAARPSRTAGRSLWLALLAGVLVWSVFGAAIQIAAYPNTYPDRDFVFDAQHQPPASIYDPDDYDDVTLPLVSAVGSPRASFGPVRGGRARAALMLGPGQRIVLSNVLAAPYLVHIAGASVIGRTAEGFMVLRVPARHPARMTLTAEQAASAPIEIGRALSALGCALLLALACAGLARRRAHKGPGAAVSPPLRATPAG
jgi:hypothetical protein